MIGSEKSALLPHEGLGKKNKPIEVKKKGK
jgi:hypothetical protein